MTVIIFPCPNQHIKAKTKNTDFDYDFIDVCSWGSN